MTTINKIKCSCCNKEKDVKDFYSSNSHFHSATKRMHVCKGCYLKYIGDDVNKLKEALRMIDKPFILSLYQSSIEEAEKTKRNLIGVYMKNVVMNQYKEFTWEDSEFEGHKKSETLINSDFDEVDEYSLLDGDLTSLRKKWGKFEKEDYIFLENFYLDYENNYSTDTPAQINLYKNIAKVQLQAEKKLSEGNTKEYKDLMELSSKLHNDANIKPIQNTGANDDRGLSTYGLWIKEIEKEEPCEYFKDKPTYEDYDGFKKYWEKWFIRPFKNIFNISKDFDVGDDKR